MEGNSHATLLNIEHNLGGLGFKSSRIVVCEPQAVVQALIRQIHNHKT